MPDPGVWLQDLSWPEAKTRIDSGAVIIVPIGAAAKEHAHHLPLKTDYLLARELADRVRQQLPVVVAPIISFGYFPAFIRYPGSQHLRADTFIALLTDVLGKFVRDGAERLAVINTGVSTEAPVRIAVRDLYETTGVRVHVADIRSLGRRSEQGLEQALGGHADEGETSMILAIEPDSVRMDAAATDYGKMLDAPATVFYQPTVFSGDPNAGIDYSATGARGDPTLASAAKGERILATMTAQLVEGLRALFPDALAP